MTKPVLATRFLSRKFMDTLGLSPLLDSLFTGIGVPAFFGMGELTYLSLTLEFLSSYTYDKETGIMNFRVMNNEVTWNLERFTEVFRLIRHDNKVEKAPPSFRHERVWSRLTAVQADSVQISHLHTNDVQHPGARLLLRTMTGVVLARPDVSKCNKGDVEILGGYLNPYSKEEFRIDMAHTIASHFARAATGKFVSHTIGGLVTWMTKAHYEIDEIQGYEAATTTVPYIDREWLTDHHYWVRKDATGKWYWFVQDRRWLPLPCAELPPMVARTHVPYGEEHRSVHYCIPLTLAPLSPEEEPQRLIPTRRSRAGPPSATVPQTPNAVYDPNSFLERRYIHESCTARLTQYGLHSFLVREGAIPLRGPHPPFWRGVDGYPGSIFVDHGIDPATFTMNSAARYGGLAGQFLGQENIDYGDFYDASPVAGSSGVGDAENQHQNDDMDRDI